MGFRKRLLNQKRIILGKSPMMFIYAYYIHLDISEALVNTTESLQRSLTTPKNINECCSCEPAHKPSPLIPLVIEALVPLGDTQYKNVSHQNKTKTKVKHK